MFVEIDGQQVHTAAFGSGAPPVLLIPGGFAPWEIWQQPMEILSRRYRVFSFDHFGSGLTVVPERMVTFDHQVLLVERLLDLWELDRPVLVGDSNNAAVAAQVALNQPDRLGGLGLVAGGVRHEASPQLQAFVAGLRSNFEATLAGFVRFCIPEEGAEAEQRWLAELIRRTGGERAARLVESYLGMDLTDRLPEISVPAMVLQGALDATPSTVGTAEGLADALADCTLEMLDGVGHVPMLTRPAAVAAAIERLIERAR
jgi:3-oxoadipate enol-lactonase/4-carboxymuconolactone decarboxylase